MAFETGYNLVNIMSIGIMLVSGALLSIAGAYEFYRFIVRKIK